MVLSDREKYRKRMYDCVVTNVLLHKMLTGNEIEQCWYNDQAPMFLSEALYKAELKDIFEFARLYPDELRCSTDSYSGGVTLLAGPRPPQLILDNIQLIRTTQRFNKPNPYNPEKGIMGRMISWKYKLAQEKFGSIYAVKKPGETAAVPASRPATATSAFGSSLARSNSTSSFSSNNTLRSSAAFSAATSGSQNSASAFGRSNSYKPASSSSSFDFRKVGQLGALAAGASQFGGRSGSSMSRSSSFGRRPRYFGSWAGLVESQQDNTPPPSIFSVPSAIRDKNEIGEGMTNRQFLAAANRLNNVPPSRALPPELADEEDDDSPALTPWDDGESDDSEHDYAVPVRKRLIGFSPVTATTEAAPKPEEQKEKKPTEPVAAPKVEEVKTEVPKPTPVEAVKVEIDQPDSETLPPPRKRFMFGAPKSMNTTADLLKLNAAPSAPLAEPPKPTVSQVVNEQRPAGMESTGTQFPEAAAVGSEYSCGVSSLYLHRLRWYRQRRGEMV